MHAATINVFNWPIVAILSVFFFFVCLLLLHFVAWSILYCLLHLQFYMQYVPSVCATCNVRRVQFQPMYDAYILYGTRDRATHLRVHMVTAPNNASNYYHLKMSYFSLFLSLHNYSFIYLTKAEIDYFGRKWISIRR